MSEKKLQQFLDEGQYSKNGLKRYEWIFGETFLSTGGINTTTKVLNSIPLKTNLKILDIGSGVGGHSFLLAELFDADVIGLDLSVNMVEIANDHLKNRPHLKDKVQFKIEDCTKCDFPENSLDLVYSRDALLHIEDKVGLFKKIYKWLKPNGQILFTDYVRGENKAKYSPEFKDYLKQRGYHMATLSNYHEILDEAGFKNVEVRDWRKEFKSALQTELDRLRNHKNEFLSKFSQKDFDDLETGWAAKIERVDAGFQAWVLGIGKK